MSGETKTSVSFAPTAAFERAFGKEEAEQQKRQFDSPTANPLLKEDEIDRDAMVGIAFCAGLVLGAATALLLLNLLK
jgi:hypothetical protein